MNLLAAVVEFLTSLNRADAIAVVAGLFSGIVALIALGVAWYGIGRSNRNSSAATFITLSEAFRQAWLRYFDARRNQGAKPDDTQAAAATHYEFSDLLNLFELGCTLHHEKSLVGATRKLAETYLADGLKAIEDDEVSLKMMETAIHAPDTFEYINLFLKYLKKSGKIRKYKIAHLSERKD